MDLDLIARRDRRIARATQIVLRDLTVRRSRDDVARAVGLEPTYFSRRFQEIVGVAFARWGKSVRVRVACELLGTTDRQVRDIAAAVGYQGVTTFERVFRQVTGMCPTEYRAAKDSRNTPTAEGTTRNADRIESTFQ